MTSIRIDCPGEIPEIDHIQRHTQALLRNPPQGAGAMAQYVRAQAKDLLADGQATGLHQDQILALCLEVTRQLLGLAEQEREDRTTGDVHLSFGLGRKIRPSEPFRDVDLAEWVDILEDHKLQAAAYLLGETTQTEQATGFPDPERLIIGAAACLIEGYLALSGNSLHCTYEVNGTPRWADADPASPNAQQGA